MNVNIDKDKLIKYLDIAAKQRKRAAAKFVQDYGPSSATVKEVTQEIAQLDLEISRLNSQDETPTPIEEAAASKKR